MAKSTAVETANTETAVAVSQADIDALMAQQASEFGDDMFQTPILKIGQPLTREVQAEQAEAGEFINTLTGEGVGTKVGFIVSYYQQGRFASDQDSGRAYVAFQDTIPEAWSDLVGEEFVGTPFSEYPDAEEVYKARVNRKEIPWGKGPLVSTTHNFTGHVLVDAILDEDGNEVEPESAHPVRLSLKRTDVPAARRWITLQKSMRNKPFWERVFDLSTVKNTYDRGSSFNLVVKLGRETTPDEKVAAVELATAVAQGRVTDNQASEGIDKAVEPDAKGGLAV